MTKSEVQTLAVRLLELQQRFESYVLLHEEELREMRATLSEMRQEIMRLNRPHAAKGRNLDGSSSHARDQDNPTTESDELSKLLTL
jgi:hypothetical protein